MDESGPLYGTSMKKAIILVITGLIIVMVMSNLSYEQQTIIPSLKEILKAKPFEAWLSQWEIPYWGTIISIESRGYFYFVEFLIRKATHFFGYGLLAVIFYLFYTKLKWRFPAGAAFFTIIAIAALDEFRQSMIPGRSGIIEDVIIDACGAFILLMMTKLIQIACKKAGAM
ncbi:VanZ family protein [Solibacillus silvestris]|uniref:VanZ family protein n=1 Tax=Solibacillus silvestris TaxID=76853 RepID=UPI003F812E26